jgi:nucleotide-binding universal stress UspA family protein
VGYDGTRESDAALEQAAKLARRVNAELELIGVVPLPFLSPSRVGISDPGFERLLLEEVEARLKAAGRIEGLEVGCTLRIGDAADEIADASAELDLLILGSRGYGPLGRVLMGGVSAKVMRQAPCPVMVVPRGS